MALLVKKFGGTSVGSLARIQSIAERLIKARQAGHQVVAVLSAMAGETNRLIELAKGIDEQPSPREFDALMAVGEQVSVALLSMALIQRGQSAVSLLADQVAIHTDNKFGKARIKSVDASRIRAELDQGNIVVVAGFQGMDAESNITTLGRGGSDTTAVAVAAALKADECRIYTDVDGVYTSDPRIVSRARRLDCITFEEMLEMASLGAKVLQIRAVELAGKYRVPLRVLSSFAESSGGTLITYEESDVESQGITGVTHVKDEALLTVGGAPNHPSLAASILSPLGEEGIEVDMIVQNMQQNGTVDFSFTINRADYARAKSLLGELQEAIGATSIVGNTEIAKISIVGLGVRSHADIPGTMFKALSEEGITPLLITTSEIKISVIVAEKYLELGVRALHQAFSLEQK